MPPENYCLWCRDTHPGISCADHQAAEEEARRQWYINNPHSCPQCR